jgi:hypothetical protein
MVRIPPPAPYDLVVQRIGRLAVDLCTILLVGMESAQAQNILPTQQKPNFAEHSIAARAVRGHRYSSWRSGLLARGWRLRWSGPSAVTQRTSGKRTGTSSKRTATSCKGNGTSSKRNRDLLQEERDFFKGNHDPLQGERDVFEGESRPLARRTEPLAGGTRPLRKGS